jgi:hypothetical protein
LREQAQVVLEVASRGFTSTGGGGGVAVPIGAMSMYVPVGTIATMLRVGTYEKPIVFQNCSAWRTCGHFVVRDLEAWLDAEPSNARIQVTPLPTASAGHGANLPARRAQLR